MCIYDIVALLFLVFAILEYLTKVSKNKQNNLFYFSSFVLLFIMCFRSPDTGEGMGDLKDYVNLYLGKASMYDSDEVEPGLRLLISFLQVFPTSEFLYISVISLLIISPVLWGINKYSGNKLFSLVMILVVQGVWLVEFITMRQALAQSFILVAIYVFMNKEFVKRWYCWSGILVFVSSYFHSTPYIIVPLSLMVFIIPDKKMYLFMALGISLSLSSVMSKLLADSFVAYFGDVDELDRITHYIKEDVYGETGFTVLNFAPLTMLVLLIVAFSDFSGDNKYFVKAFVVGVVIYNLLGSIPLVNRAVCFMFILGLIGSLSPLKSRLQFFVLLGMISFFVWRASVHYELAPHSAFLPYHFIFE